MLVRSTCCYICSGASLTDVDNEGLDAVSWAAVGGHLHCIELMLDRGSDIDHADKVKRTPLHLASFYGHEQVVCSRHTGYEAVMEFFHFHLVDVFGILLQLRVCHMPSFNAPEKLAL